MTSKYKSEASISVAAGAAANGTYTAYINMEYYDACSLQAEWTAGAGDGTLDLKVYGSLQDDGTAQASVSYQDITNDTFGVASVSGDAIMIDDGNTLGCLKFVRIDATIANKDANTALYVYSRRKKS